MSLVSHGWPMRRVAVVRSLFFTLPAIICLGTARVTAVPEDEHAGIQATIARAKDLLSSVPPELSADSRIRLVSLGAFQRRKEQIEELQTAFSLATQSPYMARMTFISGNADTKSGYLADTYSLGLDQLSLRVNATNEMLRIDPGLALDMFRKIGPLKLPAQTCSDSLTYDVESYYRLAGSLYGRAFDSIEISNDNQGAFLDQTLSSITNPAQLVPALELLIRLKLDPIELSRSEAVLARAMGGIENNAGSLGAIRRMLSIDLYRLESTYQGENRVMLQATKAYVEANLANGVCRDDVFMGELINSNPTTGGNGSKEFAGLNDLLHRYGIVSIKLPSLATITVGGEREKEVVYWETGEAKDLLLQFTEAKAHLASLGPSSPEWQSEVRRLLSRIAVWTGSSDGLASGDLYMQKALLLSRIVGMVPWDCPAFQDCLTAYITFLSTPPSEKEVELFWLMSVKHLTRELHSGNSTSAIQRREEVDYALSNTPSPAISLVSLLESLGGSNARLPK
jgi:hypothetical protein